jgi:predicted transcriptional regulator
MKKEEKVLKTLKDFGRLSTSRIGAICGMSYTVATIFLEDMAKRKLIKKEEETRQTYWRLKE